MSKTSIPNKRDNTFSAVLQNDIRQGVYSPGEKLPSECGLCLKYGFSRPTIHKNLEELIGTGLLKRQGRSVFISSEAIRQISIRASKGRIVLMMNNESYSNIIYNSIVSSLSSRLGSTYLMKLIVTKGHDFKVLEKIDNDDVVIVFGLFLADGLFKAISAHCRNIFAINFSNQYGNWLMPDNYEAGRLMAECLFKHGHRKIGVVMQTNDYSEFEERYRGAFDYLSEHDQSLQRIWVPCASDFYDISELHFNRYVLNHEATGLICLRHTMSMQLYDIAFSHGVSIPNDFSIVSFDDTYGCDMLDPPLTACRYPTAAIAEKLIAAIPKAFSFERRKKFLQKRFPVMLVDRESVATLSQ